MGVGGEPWEMAGIRKAEEVRFFQDGQQEHRAESGPGHRARDVVQGPGQVQDSPQHTAVGS